MGDEIELENEKKLNFIYKIKGYIKQEKRFLISYLILFIFIFFFFRVSFINGSSMENTFFDKDVVLLEKFSYIFKEPNYGDIIVAKTNLKLFFIFKKNVIKRVIAKGNDHIEIKDSIVKVNGKILYEPYIKNFTNGEVDLIIPDGYYFVMGDNRLVSNDSRFSVGLIKRNKIVGRVYARILPFNKIGLIGEVNYE